MQDLTPRAFLGFAFQRRLALALLGLGLCLPALSQGPKRDLTVELRQIEEGRDAARGGGGRYSAGSSGAFNADAASAWEPQMVQVRNGEKATLRLGDSQPMQWTQSVQAAGAQNGAAAQQGLAWMDGGQSLSVVPKWPGGNQPVTLELEVQRSQVDMRMGADLPKQTRASLSTTVTAPLAQWVTIAASGRAAREGSYSSESSQQVRRLLQVRVMAP